MKSSKPLITVREIALFGVLGSLTFAAKLVMSGLPNIEPVSLMVMLFAVTFGKKCIYPIYVYVAMEILVYGINIWNVYYLYVWPLLVLLAIFLRDMKQPLAWALVSGVFGLLFGALCGIADACIGGIAFAVSKWASGIPFDIAHCIGNFIMALVLFKPLRELLEKLYRNMRR
jgi:energy-coupling factor transport system substrate-specific component